MTFKQFETVKYMKIALFFKIKYFYNNINLQQTIL